MNNEFSQFHITHEDASNGYFASVAVFRKENCHSSKFLLYCFFMDDFHMLERHTYTCFIQSSSYDLILNQFLVYRAGGLLDCLFRWNTEHKTHAIPYAKIQSKTTDYDNTTLMSIPQPKLLKQSVVYLLILHSFVGLFVLIQDIPVYPVVSRLSLLFSDCYCCWSSNSCLLGRERAIKFRMLHTNPNSSQLLLLSFEYCKKKKTIYCEWIIV